MIRRLNRIHQQAFATLTLLLFVVACGGGSAQGSPGAGPAAQGAQQGDGQSIVVVIANRTATALDAGFTYNQGSHRRMGTVTGNRRRSFPVEWRNGELQLRVRAESGGDWLQSNELTVSANDSLELLVTNYSIQPQLYFRGKRR